MPNEVRLLDPGAGVGTLLAAFVERACNKPDRPSRIYVTACEIDGGLLRYLAQTLGLCEAACIEAGIQFSADVWDSDFIAEVEERLCGGLFSRGAPTFNTVLANPPYRKIHSGSSHRQSLRRLGIETSNLYTGFLAASFRLMEAGGQLVAITPRSFCSGPYFLPFRRELLGDFALRHLHLFEARDQAFSEDDVLQENIIFRAVKGGERSPITLTVSEGAEAERVRLRDVPAECGVRPGDRQLFIHFETDDMASRVSEKMSRVPGRLSDIGIEVSTGRVVDFRARQYLLDDPEENAAPLIYPSHLAGHRVDWPRPGSRKPNAIRVAEATKPLLVPNGHYVLVKRFSSKEERKRVVALAYDPAQTDGPLLGIENHLNYFHVRGGPLEPTLARGLAAYLNSTVVDSYFRQFNGHTQVNATDLRNIPYPTRQELLRLGSQDLTIASQAEIDSAVEALLG